jgi:hypothetical protein
MSRNMLCSTDVVCPWVPPELQLVFCPLGDVRLWQVPGISVAAVGILPYLYLQILLSDTLIQGINIKIHFNEKYQQGNKYYNVLFHIHSTNTATCFDLLTSSSCSHTFNKYIQIIQQIKILVLTNCGCHKIYSRYAELVSIV